MSALVIGRCLVDDWRYWDGVSRRHGLGGIRGMHSPDALNFIYAFLKERVQGDEDAAEVFDGWMTCTLAQAIDFLRIDAEAEAADRLAAGKGLM